MRRRQSVIPSEGWIDVSVRLRSGMVHWPGDPDVKIERILKMERGDHCNVSTISMSSHTGTHVDAPYHFIENGDGIHDMAFTSMIGQARVIEIENQHCIKPEELKPNKIRKGERVLFKTINSKRCWNTETFVEDFVYLSTESIEYLVEKRVKTIGVDYLSVGGYIKNIDEVHKSLLGAGIWIIEGLNLSRVSQGNYDLICLPLNIINGDGAPARAILRPI
ncbi:cyclase family protein [Desulfobacterota bacterium AH_259_B03_O07]|nr:cyclase family protein [Desulfobacterota bacterium AH_259_B03_O07]